MFTYFTLSFFFINNFSLSCALNETFLECFMSFFGGMLPPAWIFKSYSLFLIWDFMQSYMFFEKQVLQPNNLNSIRRQSGHSSSPEPKLEAAFHIASQDPTKTGVDVKRRHKIRRHKFQKMRCFPHIGTYPIQTAWFWAFRICMGHVGENSAFWVTKKNLGFYLKFKNC